MAGVRARLDARVRGSGPRAGPLHTQPADACADEEVNSDSEASSALPVRRGPDDLSPPVPHPAFLRLLSRSSAAPPDDGRRRDARPERVDPQRRAGADRRRDESRRTGVPLGRRLDRQYHDRSALPARPGGIRDRVRLRLAPRPADRSPGAQRARHRHRRRRVARCPRLRRSGRDDRGRLCRERELGRHARPAAGIGRGGNPGENRPSPRGLRNRRSRWSRSRQRSRRGRRGATRGARGGARTSRSSLSRTGAGTRCSPASPPSTRERTASRSRSSSWTTRLATARWKRSDTSSTTYGSWSFTRTSASQPASTSAPASPPATTCSCSIPTAWCTTGQSGSSWNSPRLNPRHGIYGGRTLWPDGTLCPGSCWGRPSVWSLFCFATLLSTALKGSRVFDPESLGGWQRDSVRDVDIVTGCLLLIPARLWEELGGFDTRFFMYGEDADLSLRASALGRRPAITPRAVTTHEVGVSSASRGDKLILLFTGKATLIRKHWRPFRRRLGLALLWLGVGVRAVGGLVRSPVARRSGWIAVWKARRTWMRGYAYRESAAVSTAELSVSRHAPPRG